MKLAFFKHIPTYLSLYINVIFPYRQSRWPSEEHERLSFKIVPDDVHNKC